MRTAKAVKTLAGQLRQTKNRPPLVGAIAHAKLETNSTAMGRSLKSAKAILECLRTTRWDLFSAVAQIQDERKTDADTLDSGCVRVGSRLTNMRWLVDWPSKLSEAEGKSDQAAHAAQAVDAIHCPRSIPEPKPGWKQVGTATKTRLSHAESISETQGLLQELEEQSEAAAHRPMDFGGRVAMSVGTLSSQQLRSLVEDKWQQD